MGKVLIGFLVKLKHYGRACCSDPGTASRFPLHLISFPSLHSPPDCSALCLRFSCSAVHQLTSLQLTKPTDCGLILSVPLANRLQLPSGHQPLALLQHPSLSLYLWLSSSSPHHSTTPDGESKLPACHITCCSFITINLLQFSLNSVSYILLLDVPTQYYS